MRCHDERWRRCQGLASSVSAPAAGAGGAAAGAAAVAIAPHQPRASQPAHSAIAVSLHHPTNVPTNLSSRNTQLRNHHLHSDSQLVQPSLQRPPPCGQVWDSIERRATANTGLPTQASDSSCAAKLGPCFADGKSTWFWADLGG